MVLLAKSEKDLQFNLDVWAETLSRYNMNINITKTKAMVIAKNHEQVTIMLEQRKIEQVPNFKYLGTIIAENGKLEDDLNNRIAAATKFYYAMNKCLISKKEISKETKTRVFNAVYIPILTYSSETWTLTQKQKQRIKTQEMRFLRRIEGCRLIDKISNEKIRKNLGVTDINKKMETNQLRWLGHLLRMPESRYAKMGWKLKMEGKRNRGRPRIKWEREMRKRLEEKGVSWRDVPQLANDRKEWRKLIQK